MTTEDRKNSENRQPSVVNDGDNGVLSEITPIFPSLERLVSHENPLPFRRIAGYAVAALGTSALGNLITVYFTVFLLEVAKIEPTYASVILFVGKGLNAASDPFVGYLISQSPETRFGKFRPWMLTALPFVSCLNFAIWFVPSTSDESAKIVYYFTVYCLMNVSRACFVIPYVSSVLAMSNSQQERDQLVAGRVVCDMFGSILGMSIFAFYLYIADLLQWSKATSYTFSGGTCSGIMLIVGFVSFLSIDERFVLHSSHVRWGSVFTPYGKLFRFKPYVILLFCLLFGYLGYQVALSIYALYFKYVLDEENIFPMCTVIIYVCAGFSIFGWQRLASVVGKKTTLTISTLLIMIVCWLHLFLKHNTAVAVLISAAMGALSGCCVILVPASMLPDIIAAYSLKHGHGDEAMFYSITYFIETMSFALCSAGSTLVLEGAGYQSDLIQQPPTVALALKLIIGVFSVLCFTVALICLFEYPITETVRKNMRQAIKQSMSSIKKVDTVK